VVDCSGRGTCVCGVCECETRENPEEVRPKSLQQDQTKIFTH
jgi:hypothetical protein